MRQSDAYRQQEKLYELWLCSFPGMGNKGRCRLAEHCGGAYGAYSASGEKWGEVLSSRQVGELKAFTAAWKPQRAYREMEEQGICLITRTDETYPKRLAWIPDAPYGLFVRGHLKGMEHPTVAIIGARDCSRYGAYVAEQLGAMLGSRGITIVSGMARGIDGISQAAALMAGGCSIGVLGSGVDVCYPAGHKVLYGKLIERGAVISEYPIGTPARPQNFPPRNRIVSGLADVVVVVEARERSGTLITVDTALEQGREVYAVPGRITDHLSDGCNRLIRQGAGLLLSPEAFLVELEELVGRHGNGESSALKEQVHNRENTQQGKEPGKAEDLRQEEEQKRGDEKERKVGKQRAAVLIRNLSPQLEAVYQALDLCPRSSAQIWAELARQDPEGWAEKHIVTLLMRLCMENLAEQVSPGYFCRKRD